MVDGAGVPRVRQAWRLGYRPALDGIRGLAVFAVVFAHAGVVAGGSAGIVGVAVFFTLSGFLITSLLVEEQADTGQISLKRFYLRRARRLLPALPAVLLACAAIDLAKGRVLTDTLGNLGASAFYAMNYWSIDHPGYGSFGHFWSLSVEEHFYLLWPALLLFVNHRPAAVAVVLAAGSVLLRWAVTNPDNALYTFRLTHLRLDGLLLGCLLAFALHRYGAFPVPAWVQVISGVAMAGLCLVVADEVTRAVWLPLASILAVPLLAGQVTTPSRLLTWPPLRRLGRISYGVYLWHYPIRMALEAIGVPRGPTMLVLVLALSIAVAEVSFRIIESRFLQPRAERQPAI